MPWAVSGLKKLSKRGGYKGTTDDHVMRVASLWPLPSDIPRYLASWPDGRCKHQVEVDGIGDRVASHRSLHLVLPEQLCQLLLFVVVHLGGEGGEGGGEGGKHLGEDVGMMKNR